jgi:hypothetical protein
MDQRCLPTGLVAVLVLAISASSASAQPEELELGFRWQLTPPGEGGTLHVSAPDEFCVDASRELQVTWLPSPAGSTPIVRLLAGPSHCEWTIRDLPREGQYRAVIRFGRTGTILADGEGQIGDDGVGRLALATLELEVAGRITLDGTNFGDVPAVADLRIRFQRQNGPPWPYWEGSIAPDGQYVVKLGHLTVDENVCALIGTARSMNRVHAGQCQRFEPGLRAWDLDFYLPQPGLIRVEIPADKKALPTRVLELHIDPVEPEGPNRQRPLRRLYGSGHGFGAREGLSTEFLAQRFGEYDVRLIEPNLKLVSPITGAARTVLTSKRITISAEQSVVSLALEPQ